MAWGGWLLMSLIVTVCLALIGVVIFLLVRGTRSDIGTQSSRPTARQPAESALDERFARDDIDEDEYLRRKSMLHSQ
jgi:putative membrane protein